MTKLENKIVKSIMYKNGQKVLPGLSKIMKVNAEFRATKIASYLNREKDMMDTKCDCCHENRARKSIGTEVYDTPWDKCSREVNFCSEECEESYLYEPDFDYFTCDGCGRLVCRQNPKNGWHIQYRELDGTELCLRCYEENILENGIERDKVEEGKLPGMFFSGDNREPLGAGYEIVEGYYDIKVTNSKEVCKKILALMDEGYKIVIGYESMGYGGGEGYITLFKKKIEGDNVQNMG